MLLLSFHSFIPAHDSITRIRSLLGFLLAPFSAQLYTKFPSSVIVDVVVIPLLLLTINSLVNNSWNNNKRQGRSSSTQRRPCLLPYQLNKRFNFSWVSSAKKMHNTVNNIKMSGKNNREGGRLGCELIKFVIRMQKVLKK